MNIVNICLCKECGCEQGYQIEEHPTLAECKDCQHLCDVDILNTLGFERTSKEQAIDKSETLNKTKDSLDSFFKSGKHYE